MIIIRPAETEVFGENRYWPCFVFTDISCIIQSSLTFTHVNSESKD